MTSFKRIIITGSTSFMERTVKNIAKAILTQSNDVVNYDNLIAVSVEVCPIEYAEDHVVDEPCIVATDVNGGHTMLFHSPKEDEVYSAMSDFVRWLQNEAFSTFEMPEGSEGGDGD